ncbi:EamA family transporter [Pantanalinema rosaneae CENA516]|uniref:EamA family transporter n=1 Tax=Pantanalinema rosaneae TaxID=1620701 RepID=UPI003D6FB3AD
MSLREFGLLLITVFIGITGQFFLKLGAIKLGKVSASNIVNHILSIVLTPELLIGLTFYGLSAVFYILLMTRINLSVIGPAVSMGYIFSVLMGYYFFKEPITFRHLVGLGLIACGVVLVAWKK